MESRESLKESTAFVRSIDPFILRYAWFKAFMGAFSILGLMSLWGLIIKKADSWLQPGVVTMQMVLIWAGISLVMGLIFLLLKERIDFKQTMFEEKKEQLLNDMECQKMLELDVGRISDPEFIQLRRLSSSRGKYAFETLWEVRFEIIGRILMVAISLTALSVIDVWLFLFLFVPIVPGMVKEILMNARRKKQQEELVLPNRKRDEYMLHLSSGPRATQAKLFGFTEHFWSQYQHWRDLVMLKRRELELFKSRADIMVGLVERLSTTIIGVYLGYGVVLGKFDVMKLMLIFGALMGFLRALQALSGQATELAYKNENYQYFKKFLNAKPILQEDGAEHQTFRCTPNISIRDLVFAYPGQDRPALCHCDLDIPKGIKMVIVGRNGCGKTTVLRMLTKVYPQTSGIVTYGGIDTRTILQKSLLNMVMYTTQDNGIPDLTIDEAVSGTTRNKVDYDRLEAVAKIMGMHDTIKFDTPYGYQTQIGVEWPGGVGFSSGQLQRFKIMAALYRLLDPCVHVGLFDEPMSNCDAETRALFYGALSGAEFREKTIVVVAHDPLYLAHFDTVVMMEKGRVVERLLDKTLIRNYQAKIALKISEDPKW